ncbi:MAG TPA: hypothetical protein VGM90_07340 [Kofleriaceae bacterium]|jgi:hypothetical protein
MRHLPILLLAVLAAGCAADALDDDGEVAGDDRDFSGQESPGEGKADGAVDPNVTALTTKYGLRPRRYTGLFNDSNDAETRFTTALPAIVDAINERTAAHGDAFRVTAEEVATNFITEGGYYLLDMNFTDSQPGNVIDGFLYLGTDTIVTRASQVNPWLSDDLRRLIADPAHRLTNVNEKGENTTTIYVDTIEQGVELNAAMFAWSRSLFEKDVEAMHKTWASVAPEARFFWTTIYFNAGSGFAKPQLQAHGVDYWKTKWTRGDDPAQFSRYARYNALWRTSSWEYMTRTPATPAQGMAQN